MIKLIGVIKGEKVKIKGIVRDESVSIKTTIEGSGPRGKSAYDVWLDEGNTGTEQDFLDSLSIGGGANYTVLKDKPRINNIELIDNKTFEDLGLELIVDTEIKNLF